MAESGFSAMIMLGNLLAGLFLLAIGAAIIVVVAMYIADVRQTQHSIRRNYPVIGRFRYWFEHLGEFFRQYFFSMDREEMPFNRAQRSWVYRAAKNLDSTIAFGSTQNLSAPGTVLFASHPFPTLYTDSVEPVGVTIGAGCRTPYNAPSFFNISAMSYGALSQPAVRALSRGAAMGGCWLNTGEGGLASYHLEGGCDLVFQIGTAKYGVRNEAGELDDGKLLKLAAIEQVKMFEIKISQGAKPGKGGILPGIKVTEEIAAIRGIPAGKDSISPNGHADIRNVAQLLDKIMHIRELTGKPVGFKIVDGGSGFFDQLCVAIQQRGAEHGAPDFITLDSGDGGSGAAPQSLMDNAGLTIRESLPRLIDTLTRYGLRERIKVVAAGKLVTPMAVAWALCVGADFVVSARGFMFALGCVQSLRCNKNTCPTGVTTHDPDLQAGLDPADKGVRVAQYIANMVNEVGVIAHSCGVNEPGQLNRNHARVVLDSGHSMLLKDYYARDVPLAAVPAKTLRI